MQTVFSHIVRTRFSREAEDVATEALAFIMRGSPGARRGLNKLIRGLLPHAPDLWFRTQEAEGSARPDMRGCDGQGALHILIENKFWAGLTEHQPLTYLRRLAEAPHATALLVIAPQRRLASLTLELKRRLAEAGIATSERGQAGMWSVPITPAASPVLAITSWTKVLDAIEVEVADEPFARSDLIQLRAMCEQADDDAFLPFSADELSDQRIPQLLLKLNGLVEDAATAAFSEGVLHRGKLMPQANPKRIGRYASFSPDGVGVWFGVHLAFWKQHGATPLWVVFSIGAFGRGAEVRSLLEPWAMQHAIQTATDEEGGFALAIHVPPSREKEAVIAAILNRLRTIGGLLSPLQYSRPIQPEP